MTDPVLDNTDTPIDQAGRPPFEPSKRSRRARRVYTMGRISLCTTIFLIPTHFVLFSAPSDSRFLLPVYFLGILAATVTGWVAVFIGAANLIRRRKQTYPKDKRMIWGGFAMGLGGGLPATAGLTLWIALLYLLLTEPAL